jgi:hypothetical protein
MKRLMILLVGVAFLCTLPVVATAMPAYWEADIGAGLNMSDDSYRYVSLGFGFSFYGRTFTNVFINSNGNITFNRPNPNYLDTVIPKPGYDIIAPLYGDFDPSTNGDVFYNASLPGKFVVTWNVVPEYVPDNQYNTFQVVLYEGSNMIQLGYNGLTTDGINWYNQDMAVGIAAANDSSFIRSATGSEIPGLDHTNIFYIWDGQDYYESSAPVPEPSTMLLFGTGLVGLAGVGRKKFFRK